MSLTADELDELYTELCHGMTPLGEPAIPAVLARLALLLMHEVGDAGRVRGAIHAALVTGDAREVA
jgi:hypothetical protein